MPAFSRAEAFDDIARALNREAHVLSVRPDLAWQQLHNRLQWADGPLGAAVAAEREVRSRPGCRPWLHRYTPSLESDALVGTLAGENTMLKGTRVAPDGSWVVSASRIIRPDSVTGSPQTRHVLKLRDVVSGAVRAVLLSRNLPAVSPDGSWMVSEAGNGPVRIWDTAIGGERATLIGHTKMVTCCAISPDARSIVTGSIDHTLKIWDVATGEPRFTLSGHKGSVWDCAISHSGRWVVSLDSTHLRIWDITTGRPKSTIGMAGLNAKACAIGPDDSWVLIGGRHDKEAKVAVVDVATGSARCVIPGRYAATSPNGTSVVVLGAGHDLSIRDTSDGSERATLRGHTDIVLDAAVSPDGARVVSASRDKTLKVWDAATGEELSTLTGHADQVVDCVLSADGKRIVSASGDDTIRIWDATAIKPGSATTHDRIRHCRVSPDGTWAVTAGWGADLEVWDIATGTPRATLTGHGDRVNDVAVSPDGDWFVSAGDDATLRVWDATTGVERFTLEHPSSVNRCAVLPDGHRVVAACRKKTLRVWEATTGEEQAEMSGGVDRPEGLAVSSDGGWIAVVGHDHRLQAWDVDTHRLLFSTAGHDRVDGESIFDGWPGGVLGCSIGADGTWMVTALKGALSPADVVAPYVRHPGTLQLWDTATGQETFLLRGHHDLLQDYAMSPDGTAVVSASEDNTIRIWNVAAGAEQVRLEGHTDSVLAVDVTADGTLVASGGDDHTIRVWDAAEGTELAALFLPGPVQRLAWSPTDATIVFGTPLGGLECARLIGATLGPPLVHPIADNDGDALRCPRCHARFPTAASHRGETIVCPREECQREMTVTPLEPARRLPGSAVVPFGPVDGADHETEKPGYLSEAPEKRRWSPRRRR